MVDIRRMDPGQKLRSEKNGAWKKLSLIASVGHGNLLSFLLRCGTRPYERGTQWDSKPLLDMVRGISKAGQFKYLNICGLYSWCR